MRHLETRCLLPILLLCAACGPSDEGPLRVERLILLDKNFYETFITDTSAPLNCSAPPDRDGARCRLDARADRFGVRQRPPRPASGNDMRVVFDRLPLLFRHQPLLVPVPGTNNYQLSEPGVIGLRCAGCTAIPPLNPIPFS